jgi:sulfatase modifying factor 1
VAQYADFLRVKNGNTSGQPAACQWNATFTPQNWPPAGSTDQAVVGVNWCDAYMYCAWAGKRLCGAVGGGPSDPADWVNAAVSEWFNACTHDDDGSHAYPYGNTYDPSACNGTDFGAHAPLSSQSTCQGGYPGIFDMSGNVIEWEDSCSSAAADSGDPPGADDCCNLRGGGFNQGSDQLRCDLGLCTARAAGGGDNGFRCCSQ